MGGTTQKHPFSSSETWTWLKTYSLSTSTPSQTATYFFQTTEPPFRDNLPNSQGDHWMHVRGVVSPTFSSGRIRKMSSHIERNATIMLDNLKLKQERGEDMELRDICACFTLDVIASTGFGLEVNTLKDPGNRFSTEAKKDVNPNPLLFTWTVFLPELAQVLSKFWLNVLLQKSMEYFANVVDVAIEYRKREGPSGKINDFLDLVINAEVENAAIDGGHGGGENELTRSEIDVSLLSYIVLIFAGYHTGAIVLSFTLFLLANHPECC
ncbi:unnamed protein product [Lymnaea stagnalis]|uniref:Cytochrome P450 n=1 Tax=Lymnaea stagnalis TaxID=6523 RepID=A0AAV2I067_LYMST